MSQPAYKPDRNKYNRVERALPYPESEKKCAWKITYTPKGRRVLEPRK